MREAPLGDLLELVIDRRGKTPTFVDAGIPAVSAMNIKNGRVSWAERRRFVTPETFLSWMPVRLRKGDVLLTTEAPLGQVAQVPTDDDLVVSQRLIALRGRSGVLDTTYLRYFLESSLGQERLRQRATG